MIILNHYLKSILYNTYIFEGKTEIDHLYFIKEIEKGIKQKENKSYSSHVRSEMTNFKYFLNNLKFNDFLNKEHLIIQLQYDYVFLHILLV